MQATLILYEGRYGFTEMVAKNLSLILGPAKHCRACEFKENGDSYDTIVICTPVYFEGADCDMIEYVSKNSDWIKQKNVILIWTCLAANMAHQYFNPLNAILGESIVLQTAVGDDMHMLIEFALNLKKIKDHSKNPVEPQLLNKYIDGFIATHNTCTLATGQGNHIRATPIEYLYKNNYIYIFSEGGLKFANILLNPNISVCIYDAYKSMSELGGMQITGTAEIIDTKTDEYLSALLYKGLNPDKIYSLPIALNLIKIHIQKVEFLWSEFSRLGYSTKQILDTFGFKEVFV